MMRRASHPRPSSSRNSASCCGKKASFTPATTRCGLASYLLLPSALPALFALLLPLEPAAVRAVLSGLLLFAFGTHQMLALVDVVTEKENRSKESLLMQGLSPRVYWLSKIAVHYPASNLSVLIAFITLFDVTSIAFSLLLSTLMRSSKFATVVGSLIAPFLRRHLLHHRQRPLRPRRRRRQPRARVPQPARPRLVPRRRRLRNAEN
ncbi:hypothetical protein DFJ73DRAFT_390468 [Zopfochytrium polystomum]|nr:hypothetical protein DFJ73DRAFT_390468 [Zopfochytrium polystomum]